MTALPESAETAGRTGFREVRSVARLSEGGIDRRAYPAHPERTQSTPCNTSQLGVSSDLPHDTPGHAPQPRGRLRIATIVAGLVSALLCILVAGCSNSPPMSGSTRASVTPRESSSTANDGATGGVVASITQQRRDQIKRVVSLRLTFDEPAPVSVTDVRLDSPGFIRQSEVPWDHAAVLIQPGVAVALPVSLAEPNCSDATSAWTTSATVSVSDAQGRSHLLALTELPDNGLLDRIRSHDCAVASLEERATFTLGTTWVPTVHDGQPVWTGHVEITRPVPSGSAIEVSGTLGSVLVDFTAMAPLPWVVPDRTRSQLPIEARSSGRCDGHSMGESSKPFVFTLWVTSQGTDVPLVLAVPRESQGVWWNLLSDACAAVRTVE